MESSSSIFFRNEICRGQDYRSSLPWSSRSEEIENFRRTTNVAGNAVRQYEKSSSQRRLAVEHLSVFNFARGRGWSARRRTCSAKALCHLSVPANVYRRVTFKIGSGVNRSFCSVSTNSSACLPLDVNYPGRVPRAMVCYRNDNTTNSHR